MHKKPVEMDGIGKIGNVELYKRHFDDCDLRMVKKNKTTCLIGDEKVLSLKVCIRHVLRICDVLRRGLEEAGLEPEGAVRTPWGARF